MPDPAASQPSQPLFSDFELASAAAAGRVVVDDRARVGLAEAHAGGGELLRFRFPGLVDDPCRHSSELGYPVPHEFAVRIEFLPLQGGIEDPVIGRGVGARARHPLPIRRVVCWVGVHERVPEPLFTGAPVNQQVLDERAMRGYWPAADHRGTRRSPAQGRLRASLFGARLYCIA